MVSLYMGTERIEVNRTDFNGNFSIKHGGDQRFSREQLTTAAIGKSCDAITSKLLHPKMGSSLAVATQ